MANSILVSWLRLAIYNNITTHDLGDCYIILHSVIENHDLSHQIYFWIGEESSLDKKACAAMHAVNLRNMLNAKTRTLRQGNATQRDILMSYDSLLKHGKHKYK